MKILEIFGAERISRIANFVLNFPLHQMVAFFNICNSSRHSEGRFALALLWRDISANLTKGIMIQ